jgi:hypothetical protein
MTEIKFVCEDSPSEFLEVIKNNKRIAIFITENENQFDEKCLGVDLTIDDAKLLINRINFIINKIEGGSHE